MGNSIEKSCCVDLAQLSGDDFNSIIKESFTVERNPKQSETIPWEEDGWIIQGTRHSSSCGTCWPCAHATNLYEGRSGEKQWRYFMNNGFCKDECYDGETHVRTCIHTLREHACGWRVCDKGKRTFWPTRLKTMEEREVWWAWLDSKVAMLKLVETLTNY